MINPYYTVNPYSESAALPDGQVKPYHRYEVSFRDTHGEVHSYQTSAQSPEKARMNAVWRIGTTVTTNQARIVSEGQKFVMALTGSSEYKPSLLDVKQI